MNKHGKFILSWEVGLLVVKTIGPFNEEGTFAEVAKVKQFVLAKNIGTWSKLVIWDEETLGSPSAIKIVSEHQEWSKKSGCMNVASVVNNSLQESVAKRIYGNESRVFLLESDARKWIASQQNT